MLRQAAHLLITLVAAFTLSGCLVAESRYLKQVEEADVLNREYNALKTKYEDLQMENTELKTDLASHQKNREELEELLNTKTDNLSKSVAELRQKILALEAENAELRKAREAKIREASGVYEKLLQDVKNEIASGQITISELKGKLTITMNAALLFDAGKPDLGRDGRAVLRKMVDTLQGLKDQVIIVEGHTDNVAITSSLSKTFPTNWELAAARAINVVKYLQRQGIAPSLLSAATFSEYRPVADNSANEGRGKNRRIEIVLMPKD